MARLWLQCCAPTVQVMTQTWLQLHYYRLSHGKSPAIEWYANRHSNCTTLATVLYTNRLSHGTHLVAEFYSNHLSHGQTLATVH